MKEPATEVSRFFFGLSTFNIVINDLGKESRLYKGLSDGRLTSLRLAGSFRIKVIPGVWNVGILGSVFAVNNAFFRDAYSKKPVRK